MIPYQSIRNIRVAAAAARKEQERLRGKSLFLRIRLAEVTDGISSLPGRNKRIRGGGGGGGGSYS